MKKAVAHYGSTDIPARRGEIFMKDYASGEVIRVATSVTLDTLFVDPVAIFYKGTVAKPHPEAAKIVADALTPIIFNPDEARKKDDERMKEEMKKAKTPEELEKIKALSDDELFKNFNTEILSKINKVSREEVIITNDLKPETAELIKGLKVEGIEVKGTILKAFPPKFSNEEYRRSISSVLSRYLGISQKNLESLLRGENRFIILKKRLSPEESAKIQKLIDDDKHKNFYGIGLKEEYYRYYPEGSLAANVLGFINNEGQGVSGIEGKYNIQLQGKKGVFKGQTDVHGRQITVGDSVIQPAVDGDSLVLTIDRAMEMKVEDILGWGVNAFGADSGQAIVMDPKTGKILAMAHYPSFDPNNYNDALELQEINLTPEQVAALVPVEKEENTFTTYDARPSQGTSKYLIFREALEAGGYIYNRYKNWIGFEAYQNKAVAAPYEPGSVFKAIAMASAIDDKDVTPNTAFNDPGILYIDYNPITKVYESEPIENVSPKCTGYVTMSHVLANSCNTGMSFVAKKMGKTLFYSYIKRFGFGERTGIEFDNENAGQVSHFKGWISESDLYTKAFGQGLTVTPIQMVAAYAAIANKGTLMQPHIVEEIRQADGKVTPTEPTAIQQVISPETANTVTAMLVGAVENGVAKKAQLPNHYIAAKTGTSQTVDRRGKYAFGIGTTIASIAGFGPIDNPQFVIYVKLDHPRNNVYADVNAIEVFRKISEYLYDYYGIPADKK